MSAIFRTESGRREMLGEYEKFLGYWPVPCERMMLNTSQGDTHVVASGDAEASALILLHGSMSNASMWLADIENYASHYRVYAVDIIGEPGLSAESRPDLHSEAYALWLDDVLTGLGVTTTALVGISLGGWLALDYTIRRPGRVTALAVLCPAGVGRQKQNFFYKVLFYLLMGKWGKDRLRSLIFGENENPSSEYVEYMAYMSRLQKTFRPRIVRFKPFTDTMLAALTMPVFAILGGRDVFFDSSHTRQRLSEHVPDCTILFEEEAGHMLANRSKPVLEFLRARQQDSSWRRGSVQTG